MKNLHRICCCERQTTSSTSIATPSTVPAPSLLFIIVLTMTSLSVLGNDVPQTGTSYHTNVQTSEAASDDIESTESNPLNTQPTLLQNGEEPHIAEARLWFLILLGVVIFLYIGQFGFCVRLAKLTRADGSTRKSDPTIWQSLRKDVESQFGIWAFVIMAFFIPFMLGIVPDIALLSGELLRGSHQIKASAASLDSQLNFPS